jgi:hypothetical protein
LIFLAIGWGGLSNDAIAVDTPLRL